MPSWGKVLKEIQDEANQPGPVDRIRRKYLRKLFDYTGRNVILYYSGWLQRGMAAEPVMIYDGDINSFMAAINGLDVNKGLDLILHTPGGRTAATEAIVSYLRKKFGTDIRAFVPQLAMSGGTMIACACKEIYMGRESSIGPIDPQFGAMAAFAVIEEFKKAEAEIKKDPSKVPMWHAIFSKIPAGFLTECQQAITLSETLVKDWLKTGMFAKTPKASDSADKIVRALNNHKKTKMHARHIDAEQAIQMGLKVSMLEDDQQLQDLVLTVHHACMHTFSQATQLQKIVENHNGVGVFVR